MGTSCWRSGGAVSVRLAERLTHAGVVRAMAGAGQGRWVSRPRGARASARVTALGPRRSHQVRIGAGVWSQVVDRQACDSKRLWGSRLSPQRMGTGGFRREPTRPSVATSTSRPSPPTCHGPLLPRRCRIGPSGLQGRTPGSLQAGATDVPRCPGRRWILAGGGETQAGAETGTAPGADLMAPRHRRLTAVSDTDHESVQAAHGPPPG